VKTGFGLDLWDIASTGSALWGVDYNGNLVAFN
jgi:hypothetical protein